MPEYQEPERMEPVERTIGCLHVGDGLTACFIDRSSKPVAERCQVQLLVRVPMQPTEDHFSNYPDPSGTLRRFISLAGPGPVEFETIKVRNFIESKDVRKTLEEMKDDSIRSNPQYIKKLCFAANFVARNYRG